MKRVLTVGVFFVIFNSYAQISIKLKDRKRYEKLTIVYENICDKKIKVTNFLEPKISIFSGKTDTVFYYNFLMHLGIYKRFIYEECESFHFYDDLSTSHYSQYKTLLPNKKDKVVLKYRNNLDCIIYYKIINGCNKENQIYKIDLKKSDSPRSRK